MFQRSLTNRSNAASRRRRDVRASPPPELFRDVFEKLGINPTRWRNYALLRPLVCNHFTVEEGQLSALGSAVVQRQVTRALFDFASCHNEVSDDGVANECSNGGGGGIAIFSSNVSKQLVSCMNNHYSYRLIYDEQLPELVELKQKPFFDSNNRNTSLLDCLEPIVPGPSQRDVAGTAFEFFPHKFGQCPSGRALAHLIGAIQVDQGAQAAQHAVDTLWLLNDDPVFPRVVARHLSALVRRYPVPNVCLAILAAQQGCVVSFTSKTIMIPMTTTHHHASSGTAKKAAYPSSSSSSSFDTETTNVKSPSSMVEEAAMDDDEEALDAVFGRSGEEKEEAAAAATQRRDGGSDNDHDTKGGTQSTFSSSLATAAATAGDAAVPHNDDMERLRNSPVAGPGFFDAVKKWKEQNQLLGVASNDNKSSEAAATTATTQVVPVVIEDDGFLSAKDRKPAAFRNSVDFSTTAFAADSSGVPPPEQGKRVSRHRFQNAVRDPSFFSAATEGGRQGIQLDDTGGYSTAEYIRLHSAPHMRTFQVTMSVTSPFEKKLAVAASDRYTTARFRCCEKYFASLIHDVGKLASTSQQE